MIGGDLDESFMGLGSFVKGAGDSLKINPNTAHHDMAKLVLGLMEFLRRLLELQAIRRMDAGNLLPEEVEALGLTLMESERAILEVANQFGLEPEDLVIDLGPFGKSV